MGMDDTKKLIEKYKRELMELSAKQKKTPKIIGYVDGDNGFLSGLQKDLIEDDIPGASSNSSFDLDTVFEDPIDTGSVSDEASSDDPPETAPEKCGDAEMSKKEKVTENTTENSGSPDVIFERPDPGKITEIIDEYAPENTANYTAVPSTEQVRKEITQNSEPQNNVIEKNVSGITDNSSPKADSTDAVRTTPEQAERLNDQPVSGTSPDEQLTGRSFEGTETPPQTGISMEQGSRAEPIDYPEQNFTNFEEFEKVNTGKGSLMFKVYTGREAVVIEGAECVITKKIGSETRTIARLVTDNSGQTPSVELPAPPKELSQHSENTIQPFALYDAQVTKPGFVRVVLKDIPVFDGVQSVQRVFMIVE